MAEHTLRWWGLLCGVAAFNLLAWALVAGLLRTSHGALPPLARRFALGQLLLSLGYVLGCGYRSLMPVYDIQRLVLVDSWWSSVIVGRSVATVAELCFAAQWALLLRGVAQATASVPVARASRLVLPMIALAELCSWHAVLTTSNLGHVLEETLWGLSATLLVISLLLVWPRCTPQSRPVLALACVAGVAYVAYMFGVDVPMYWSRWLADEALGRPYLSLAQGAADASARWVVSHRWDDWRGEVLWMSLYFSVAVWLSIALAHAPVVTRLLGLRGQVSGALHTELQPRAA